MNKLETLLNTLIARGWKPWELEYFVDVLVSGTIVSFSTAKGATSPSSLRELVSLESGLWQFVCKKDLHNKGSNWIKNLVTKEYGVPHIDNRFAYYDYEYRLIESALIPEEELAQFLIENIKTE